MELNQAKLCIARTLNLSAGCQVRNESWCKVVRVQVLPSLVTFPNYKCNHNGNALISTNAQSLRIVIINIIICANKKKKKKNLQVREKMTF